MATGLGGEGVVMSTQNDHAENFLLFVIIGGLAVAGVFYGLILFWPYFIFYVLPLVIGSLVVGFVLWMMTEIGEDKSDLVHYRSLVVSYAVLIFLVMVVFFSGSVRSVVVDKKGNLTGQYYLDWPETNQIFNQERSNLYKDAPFESLRKKANEGVIYDRQEMGWIALWCLFLGGPLFYWWLSRNDKEKISSYIEKIVEERTGYKRKRLDEKEEKLDVIIANSVADLKTKVANLEKDRTTLLAENRELKARLEFSVDIPRPSEAKKSSGVLDSDIL